MEGELPVRRLLRLQGDIEGQSHRVAMAVDPIVEALNRGGNVSLQVVGHVKAQILLTHRKLDDLEQLLDSIG